MFLIGYDVGSSSVKASLIDAESGKCIDSVFYPKEEMTINAPKPGWAEQDPEAWWGNLKLVSRELLSKSPVNKDDVAAIGISYQMHGLVIIDKHHNVLRPSIIWCDSRAVNYGDKAFLEIGQETCLSHLLNSPGNFTASKLKWVQENEPWLFEKIFKIMLPGDYIAMRMTGEINTTISGLSEGIFWDFQNNKIADFLLDYYNFDHALIPDTVPTFAIQGLLTEAAAGELGLKKGIPVSYRAGDQPNNAFSLNVLNPGEIAATAGTSGVVYGVSDKIKFDPLSRINTFAHVNHSHNNPSLGVLLCINGTGILYSWLKKILQGGITSYNDLNNLAASVKPGSEGLIFLPFGNGAERMLGNKDTGCEVRNLNFNIHSLRHMIRAAQEGIVFSFKYGLDIMKSVGIQPAIIRAGNSNMFLSPVFRETLAGVTGAVIELYDTDGSQGAAKGAGLGAGIYPGFIETFNTLTKIATIEPIADDADKYHTAYNHWQKYLNQVI